MWWLGNRLQTGSNKKSTFTSGGAGYLMNKIIIQNIINANDYNEKHCREFMFYTKYLESFAPAPEEAMFVYRKLEEYYVANRH